MPTLVVTGAAGFVGQRTMAHASAAGWETVGVRHVASPPRGLVSARWVRVDLRDPEATRHALEEIRPAAILHTAGSDRSRTSLEAIVPAARAVAEAARTLGARLVHLSTDLVFDGEHPPYDESSAPRPILEYGRVKMEAEAIVAAIDPGTAIVRTSLVYAFDPVDRATEGLLERLARGETVTLFTDEIRCPIWVENLAAALVEVCGNDLAGPLHIAGPRPMSRWEIGSRLLRRLGAAPSDRVVPATLAASGLRRPRDLTLDLRRAREALRTKLLSIDEAIGVADRTRGCPPPAPPL